MLKSSILFAVLLSVASAAPSLLGPVKLPLIRKETPLPPVDHGGKSRTARPAAAGSPSTNGLRTWGRDVKYTVQLDVGTPPVGTEVMIDTGSSLLWLMDAGVKTEFTDSPGVFNHNKSSTFKYKLGPDGKPLQGGINYLKGSTVGHIGTDVVGIGGQSLPDQYFLAAEEWSSDMDPQSGQNVTGLLGLGFPRNETEGTPIWKRLSDTWADKRFGVFLERVADKPDDIPAALANITASYPGGEITLGGVDESRFTGEINYIPKLGGNANFTSHWAVPLDSISLKGKPLDFVKPGTPAILDTGATLLLGPEADVEKFYSSIPGADKDFLFSLLSGTTVYSIPCNTTSATFDLSFKIGGIDYPIHESDFYFLKAPLNTGGSFCIGSVMGSALDFWLLGDTFLKNVYSVYRLEPPSVGFAKLKKN